MVSFYRFNNSTFDIDQLNAHYKVFQIKGGPPFTIWRLNSIWTGLKENSFKFKS